MSLFLGIYSITRSQPITSSTVKHLTSLISGSGETIETFSTPYFCCIKFDFGAFREPGYINDPQYGLAAIAGEPIVVLDNKENYSRFMDLKTLSGELYHERIEILQACHGTFSLCYYHPEQHALFLATDKLGSRPLYYYNDEHFLYFSSCLKYLEAIEAIPKRGNVPAFIEQTIFLVPLGTKTLYCDINVLEGGQYLHAKNTEIHCSHYFRWDRLPVTSKTMEDILEESYTAFQAAVISRSQREQTVSSFLSGGLDSRCVVAMLHTLGKEVIGFNSSRPDEQDQIFAEQYARQLGIKYIVIQRPRDASATFWLFQDATQPHSEGFGALEKYPHLIFSGDGGSVGVGFAYMDETMFDLLRREKIDEAIQYYLRPKILPRRIINPKLFQHLDRIRFSAMKAEFNEISGIDPQRRMFLFFLRNDQRRHLHDYYEQIAHHRVELLTPFYDSRLLSIIVSAPPELFPSFLYHKFYHQWLERFPESTRAVPWQTYPGHAPCPVPNSTTGISQWEFFKHDKFVASQSLVKKCWGILWKSNFPHTILNRPAIGGFLLLHTARIQDYSYIFRFSTKLYEFSLKCTEIPMNY